MISTYYVWFIIYSNVVGYWRGLSPYIFLCICVRLCLYLYVCKLCVCVNYFISFFTSYWSIFCSIFFYFQLVIACHYLHISTRLTSPNHQLKRCLSGGFSLSFFLQYAWLWWISCSNIYSGVSISFAHTKWHVQNLDILFSKYSNNEQFCCFAWLFLILSVLRNLWCEHLSDII